MRRVISFENLFITVYKEDKVRKLMFSLLMLLSSITFANECKTVFIESIYNEIYCQGCSKRYYKKPTLTFERALIRKGYTITEFEDHADLIATQYKVDPLEYTRMKPSLYVVLKDAQTGDVVTQGKSDLKTSLLRRRTIGATKRAVMNLSHCEELSDY